MSELTNHVLYIGSTDEQLSKIGDNTIQLILTSPPYWNARDYKHSKQIGFGDNYHEYLTKIRKIAQDWIRILMPDGKIALNIGNIFNFELSQKRTFTVNLILDLWRILYQIEQLRFMGTIYWKKSTSRDGAVLFGSYPYPSTFMISTALEAIHIFRKIGKRKVPKDVKVKSKLNKKEFRQFREPIWYLNGLSRKDHPAVFPNELVYRLIKMYSFCGDTVLDPFCGIGTVSVQAMQLNRNSIGIDVKKEYIRRAEKNLKTIQKEASVIIYDNNR